MYLSGFQLPVLRRVSEGLWVQKKKPLLGHVDFDVPFLQKVGTACAGLVLDTEHYKSENLMADF